MFLSKNIGVSPAEPERGFQMANLKAVTTLNRPHTDTKVVLEGIDYPLIEPGQYEAYLVSYETGVRFARKVLGDNSYMEGGKIYMHFRIDPLNNAGLGNQEIIIFMPFNAKTIIRPFGRNGEFTATRRSNYGKLMRRLIGPEKCSIATPNALKDKLFIVNVRTVEKDEKQRSLRKEERYSVIDEILDYA